MKFLAQKISLMAIGLMLILGPIIVATPITTPTAYAQDNCKGAIDEGRLCIPKPRTLPGPTEEKQNKTYFRDTLLVQLTRTLVSLAGGLAFLFFIFGGVQMLTAYGNEDQYTKAKKTLIWSIVGFLLAMFSFTIVSIIGNIEITPNQRTGTATTTDQSTNSGSTTNTTNSSSSNSTPPPPPPTP